jgi:hypothetical protein
VCIERKAWQAGRQAVEPPGIQSIRSDMHYIYRHTDMHTDPYRHAHREAGMQDGVGACWRLRPTCLPARRLICHLSAARTHLHMDTAAHGLAVLARLLSPRTGSAEAKGYLRRRIRRSRISHNLITSEVIEKT